MPAPYRTTGGDYGPDSGFIRSLISAAEPAADPGNWRCCRRRPTFSSLIGADRRARRLNGPTEPADKRRLPV